MLPRTFRSLSYVVSGDVTTNMKLKAVIFDVATLCLDSQISNKDEIKKYRIEEDKDDMKKKTINNEKIYKDKNEIEGFSNVQSKYMDKLGKKLGSIGRGELSSLRDDSNKRMTDFSLLNEGRSSLAKEHAKDDGSNNTQKALGWLLRPGMGAIVDYIGKRSMKLGLLMKDASPFVINTLKSQLSASFIEGKDNNNDNNDNNDMKNIIDNIGSDPNNILIISRNDSILEQASNAGVHTCRFRTNDDRYGSIYTHFKCTSAIEIQDVLDECCGVAYRESAFNSRIMKP